MFIFVKVEIKIVSVFFLIGEVNVMKDIIIVLGDLKFNFLGVIKFGGMVRVVYGFGFVFFLDVVVDFDFVGVKLVNVYFYIRDFFFKLVVWVLCSFMGLDMNVEIWRCGLLIIV